MSDLSHCCQPGTLPRHGFSIRLRSLLRVDHSRNALVRRFFCFGILFALVGQALGEGSVRIATFNIAMYGNQSGEVEQRLSGGRWGKAIQLASIIQKVRPDILLLNEIDYDDDQAAVDAFAKGYLSVPQNGLEAIDYPFRMVFASNTGIPSGMDLNHNGKLGDPEDAWGFGRYPGQYAMAVLSRYPIDRENVRTFKQFLWSKVPDARRPIDPTSKQPYYDDETWSKLRLSSKTHADVPVQIGSRSLHFLISHPTPPVFDGPADHNGCRNADEVRFWSFYLNDSSWIIDDESKAGGLPKNEHFVIAGDLNADADAGDGQRDAIDELLNHPRVNDSMPARAAWQSDQKDSNARPIATTQFGKSRFMRIDYALPSGNLRVTDGGIYWPDRASEGADWVNSSDHRLVWVDVVFP
ncbi:MAG: endonuclease/exonuclease/phosphatase family protein [Planctomycetota bacterium]